MRLALLPLLALAAAALLQEAGAKPRGHRHRWSPYLPDTLFVPFGPGSKGVAGDLTGLRGGDTAGAGAATNGISPGAAGARAAAAAAKYGDHLPAGVAYRQLVARSANGTLRFSDDLNMTLPQPWDLVNLTQVLEDNLAPTLRFWRRELRRKPRVRDLFDAAVHSELFAQTDTRRLVVIHNNAVTFPLMPPGLQQFDCDDQCNPQLAAFVDAMRAAVRAYGLKLPNVVLNLNVIDGGAFCAPPVDAPRVEYSPEHERECAAPAVSITRPDGATNLLAPSVLLPDANVTWRHAPWPAKAPRAFFRGVPSCGETAFEPRACARIWVARLGQLRPELFDAGLVEPILKEAAASDPTMEDGRGPPPVLPRVPRDNLTHYKYLLNLDSQSAAFRFATLLGTNSLVLKQASRHMEWFYSSVRPGEHYLPILESSRTDVLDRLSWAEAHEDEARAIVDRANRFALTYTTYYARVLYWVYALEAYRSLFDDQDYYFESRGADVRDLVTAHHKSLARRAAERGKKRAAAAAAADEAAGGETGGGGEARRRRARREQQGPTR